MTQLPFDYSEIALADAMIQMSKGVSVNDLKPMDDQEAWDIYCEIERLPKPGSVWFNDRQKKNYTVMGAVSLCADKDEWEVLYRDEDWPAGQYRRRPVSEWYGLNRDGVQRFVEVKDQ